ncbi:MAG: hypothetical protein F4213_13135 [Boseongicola sp. SB0677_bin_26]|nr:hypothetical protein [Boseongicola sp. SB0665_bin_10]MYG26944.1 hypothetical protein [Boseongicola sp. SB0677_bin_26]
MEESLRRLTAARDARREQEQQLELRIERRIALHDALETLGVKTVEATYEGHGGSGNVLEVLTDPPERLPDAVLSLVKDVAWDTACVEHPGFEMGDGAEGCFKWFVKLDAVGLEHVPSGHRYQVSSNVDFDPLRRKLKSDPDVVARNKGKVLREAGIDPDQLDAIIKGEHAERESKMDERLDTAADETVPSPSF